MHKPTINISAKAIDAIKAAFALRSAPVRRSHAIGRGRKTLDSQCYQDRSRYTPHQGRQEMARRRMAG